jgi:hypothetical protein
MRQKRSIQALADRKGWIIIFGYEEPKSSAKDEEIATRPQLAALLAEEAHRGLPPLIPLDVHRGLGVRLDTPTRAMKRAQLLDMALGVFSSAGVVHSRVQREADDTNVGDLLLCSLDVLEEIAVEKGGIRHLPGEKWRRVYQANAPRGLFTRSEVSAA